MNRAVFLDRDGVLNRALLREGSQASPRSLDEFELTPGAAGILRRLKAAGFLLICVTNQPELARGDLAPEALETMNAVLRRELPLDDLFVCPHDDAANCDCRKPKPGLVVRAAAKHDVDLGASFVIGDRWRDVEAGARAGCRTVFLDGGYDDRRPSVAPDATVRSLEEAASWVLSHAQASVLD